MQSLRIGYVKETFRRQHVSDKIMVFRKLRRLNFGRMDHKRKAWWTIDLLRSENHEINWNKYYADCEEVESREWRKAFKILVDNYIAENADIKFNYENKNSMTPGRRYWLIFIIRIILSFGIILGICYNQQFGKEYSSCNAGDGPPKKDINSDRSRPRSNTLPIPLTVNCSPPSILGRRSVSSPPVFTEEV